jgi:UDP-N-acetylglucosamine--N-acetylmuramyl-(pentapeptide) pyrophosphoryl-undecaprenol N-acetylglucosamine transferase
MRMIIAGGGTGGHLFPGVAIAEEFLRRCKENQVLFVGTKRGLEFRILQDLGFELKTIRIEGIKGRGLKSLLALFKIPWSMAQSMRIIRVFSPEVVIGVGGYASGPVVLAACLLGIPTAIAEQNARPGATNRILSIFAGRIFVSFSDSLNWLPIKKTVVTGNPIRAGFDIRCAEKEKKDRFNVLIFGGSQGAHAINRSLIEALPRLQGLKSRLRFVHQTGDKDAVEVEKAYRGKGMDAQVLPFIRDMAAAYRSADLLICRAGATSIAEITACGKAAILIPFPHAVYDHQTENARVLVGAGAAEMVVEKDLNGQTLAETIRRLCDDPDRIRRMEENAMRLRNPGAAADIVSECLKMVASKYDDRQS